MMSKNQILSLTSEIIHSRGEIKIRKYINESKTAILLGSVNERHVALGVHHKDSDLPRMSWKIAF